MRGVVDLSGGLDKCSQHNPELKNSKVKTFDDGGNRTEVLGKFVEVYKVDDKKVSAEGKGAIKKLVQLLAMTIDKYYAFGSVFVDDSG